MRRLLPALVLFAFAGLPGAASAATTASSNWAGYAVHRAGVQFRSVSAAWTVPAVSCIGGAAYSAAWVGLGGYHANAAALEQAGTESDCTASDRARYTAWYEVVPASAQILRMSVSAGDRVGVRVSVRGHRVTIRLRDLTRGTAFTRRLTARTVDTTAAEWIVEAPSECVGARCRVLPLSNFAAVTFSGARATSAAGHTGAIADPLWTTTAIDLQAGGPWFGGPRGRPDAAAASATAGALSASGDSFTVTVAPSG